MVAAENRKEARAWPRVVVVLLIPGGKLAVTTPNIRILRAHVFGEYKGGLEVLRHMFCFDPQALRECTKVVRLPIRDFRTTTKNASYICSSGSLTRRDGVVKDGSPETPGLRLRMERIVFPVVEHGLSWRGQEGERSVTETTEWH